MAISIENAEHYIWGNQCDGWHLVKNQDLSVIQERMPAGTSEVKHYHSKARQFFFILSGTAEIRLDGETHTLNRFEGLEIPPQAVHQIFNSSPEAIEFLVISQPNSRGDRAPA
ncbi:cupin domain-containing protein [Peribacillus deserti]|uniref:Cupin domain-containing protein n=1 Tax=Peribacillus deserti TaxID=673318 RepID=A0A2N5M1G9_9BACI|nr:cupin domain-containing protein [Peribacillus deserti]PLT28234.1 cupin domain-containing protein [Peribacillus deserti]